MNNNKLKLSKKLIPSYKEIKSPDQMLAYLQKEKLIYKDIYDVVYFNKFKVVNFYDQ